MDAQTGIIDDYFRVRHRCPGRVSYYSGKTTKSSGLRPGGQSAQEYRCKRFYEYMFHGKVKAGRREP